MKFSEYITEAKEGKNVHLEHLEDNVLNNGSVFNKDKSVVGNNL
jgi:hypothetical protein